ncbi:MAG: alpha/beta hydrolase [Selenomonadaceae bacterium]|nr:alpha/beta hydrolase [Selenomonadaceae bacterium]
MKNLAVYIHGKGGTAAEAEHYAPFFDVTGFDYKSETPWEAAEEFPPFFNSHCAKILIANSIGAYFAMTALADKKFDAAFFISPVVDMEKLILNMMRQSNVTEAELRERQEIGNLSWKYLSWVRANPIRWQVPTHILYGENDALTSRATIENFAEKIGATLTVMAGGEHWFHTPEQMAFLDKWLEEFL